MIEEIDLAKGARGRTGSLSNVQENSSWRLLGQATKPLRMTGASVGA